MSLLHCGSWALEGRCDDLGSIVRRCAVFKHPKAKLSFAHRVSWTSAKGAATFFFSKFPVLLLNRANIERTPLLIEICILDADDFGPQTRVLPAVILPTSHNSNN